MKRIYIALCLILICSFATACQQELIDTPYVFEVTPYDEEWKTMSSEECIQASTIPLSVAKRMTTRALLESFLNAPFITGIHSADIWDEKSEESVERYIQKFPTMTELLERDDVIEELEAYMNAYQIPEDDSWDDERLRYDVACALYNYVENHK